MEELYFIECGKKRKAQKSICTVCSKDFLHRLGQERPYCSKECKALGTRKRVVVECSHCGKPTEKVVAKLKCSKHGYYFCDRACKEKAQKLDGSCPEIRPSHYGTAKPENAYRRSMLDELKNGCSGCGEERKYLLIVHHIDGNRENASKENLEVVCGNCHMLRHLRFVDNEWIYSPSFLTPRDESGRLLGP